MKRVKEKNKAKAIVVARPRPFLKWVGGKAKLVPELEKLYPKSFNKFYEPFVGGGAMFFSINPTSGHINDMNEILINAYKHVRDDLDTLIKELTLLHDYYWELPNIETKKKLFMEKRTLFNSLDNDMFEKTVLLIFLNKTCFNGMYRENSKGKFNVPFNNSERPPICDAINLRNVSNSLQKTKITHLPYEKAIKLAKEDDFVYFDPPYDPLNKTSGFTSYHASGFGKNDQEKLRDAFVHLAKKGCNVMLSNSNTPFINELYKDFKIHKISAARNINSVGSKRGKVTEVVVTNY